jgi:hypothetical protein
VTLARDTPTFFASSARDWKRPVLRPSCHSRATQTGFRTRGRSGRGFGARECPSEGSKKTARKVLVSASREKPFLFDLFSKTGRCAERADSKKAARTWPEAAP